jgi:hypothetical protein
MMLTNISDLVRQVQHVRGIFVQQQDDRMLWRFDVERAKVLILAAPPQIDQQSLDNVVSDD